MCEGGCWCGFCAGTMPRGLRFLVRAEVWKGVGRGWLGPRSRVSGSGWLRGEYVKMARFCIWYVGSCTVSAGNYPQCSSISRSKLKDMLPFSFQTKNSYASIP